MLLRQFIEQEFIDNMEIKLIKPATLPSQEELYK